MKQQVAKLNYLHIAPRKVRLIASTLKGLSVQEAEAQLMMRTQRSSRQLLKLLRSAIANAQNNQKLNPDQLIISSIRVDQGPMLKRSLPRAMGRATPIHKKMSQVTLVLAESPQKLTERFSIIPPPKKEKTKKEKPKAQVPAREERRDQSAEKKAGFFKRLFRRKAV